MPMEKSLRLWVGRVAVVLCLLGLPAAAEQIAPVITTEHQPNTAEQQQKHYVILVSLDGFRYDYAKKYGAKHLLAMGAEGAEAPDGMVPSYPSLTFPNHYTLVTGLYPEHHGIIANRFYDPERKETYSYHDKTNADGSWYGGTPLWVLAEQQGMRSACFFWPGSEAAIQGVRPTYYLHYDNNFDDEKRVEQVLAWLKLPVEDRPHFITLYYPNVDHEGHEHGPDSPEVAAAVLHVDEMMGKLEAGVKASGLPVDLIVLADHGMEHSRGGWITLDAIPGVDLSTVYSEESLLYPKTEAAAARVYQELKKADGRFTVYRRKDVPAGLHFNENPREGDPVLVPTGPYAIRAHGPKAGAQDKPPTAGMHGFDPAMMPTMRAIFFAEGPDIKPDVKLKPFENVNVYPLIAKILGLNAPKVDGSLNVLSGVLKEE